MTMSWSYYMTVRQLQLSTSSDDRPPHAEVILAAARRLDESLGMIIPYPTPS